MPLTIKPNFGTGYPSSNLTSESVPQRLSDIRTRDAGVNSVRWRSATVSLNFYAGSPDGSTTYDNSFTPNPGLKMSFNEIAPKVNYVLGSQRQNRKSGIVMARNQAGEEFAELCNSLLEYANAKRDLPNKFSEAWGQGVITGLMYMEVYLDKTDDPLNGDVDFVVRSYNNIMCDPSCRDPFLSDSKYMIIQYFSSRQSTAFAFPQKANEIMQLATGQSGPSEFYFLPENNTWTTEDSVIVTVYWEPITVMVDAWVDTTNGDLHYELPEVFARSAAMEHMTVPRKKWKRWVLVNDLAVEEKVSPYCIDKIPLIPMYWDYETYIPNMAYRYRGLPFIMVDNQFMINTKNTMLFTQQETSWNSGVMYYENSIVNKEALENGGEGIKVCLKSFDPENPVPPPIQLRPIEIAQTSLELNAMMVTGMERQSGITNANTAANVPQAAASGIAQMTRQMAETLPLQRYMDNCDRSLKATTEYMVRLMLTWKSYKIARITGKPIHEVERIIAEKHDYDVIVSEGLYTDVQKRNEFIDIIQLCQALNLETPVDLAIEKSTIQGKLPLQKALAEERRQKEHIQQEQMHMEMAKQKAELRRIDAETAATLSIGREREAKRLANMGIEDEREAEVKKNIAAADKTNIETVEKIAELISLYGFENIDRLYKFQQDKQNIAEFHITNKQNRNGNSNA